jgi:acyl carrier protein
MSTTVQDQILAFIRDRFPQVELSAAEDIFALGFVNSLFAMELVLFIENTFGFTIASTELILDNFRTADSMAALVARANADRSVAPA